MATPAVLFASNKVINPYVGSKGSLPKVPAVDPLLQQVNQYSFNQLNNGTYRSNPPATNTIDNSKAIRDLTLQAQLNPRGTPLRVETINSTLYGTPIRQATDYLASTRIVAGSPTLQTFTNFVGYGNAATVDSFLGPSDPSYLVSNRDGTRTYHMGEGQSTGSLATQVSSLAVPLFSNASRSAGSLLLRAEPRPSITAPSTVVQRTNAQLVSDVAVRAERKIGGTGAVAGVAKHGYADDLLTRYQQIYGDRGLSTEVRYLNGQVWQKGMGLRDTVRLDVVEGPVERQPPCSTISLVVPLFLQQELIKYNQVPGWGRVFRFTR